MCIVLQDYKGTMPRDLISDFFDFTYIHNTHIRICMKHVFRKGWDTVLWQR